MRKISESFSNIQLTRAICLVFAMVVAFGLPAQRLNASYLAYIEQYKDIALAHEQEFGIPACITLAQGLLESSAGKSYLARRGNNHFGIKCYSWSGPAVEYDDSLQHSCYRSYGCAEDSFLDHAKFLKGKRYSSLYSLDITDYAAWAAGLRACGYAEDPAYPKKLIAIIELYALHRLTPSVAAPSADQSDSERVRTRVAGAFGSASSRKSEPVPVLTRLVSMPRGTALSSADND